MDRKDVFEYVKKQYGTVPEYLWKESPESAVLRHKNGKWYAVLMQVKKSKLELEGEGTVDIINVKCEPDMVGVLIETYGFLPGYHMNHGLTQVLYEFASSAANNGSGFEGLADNTAFWNITAGLAMFFGRYIAIIAQLAIAGSMLAKKKVNETVGTLRTDNITFMIILVFIVYIFAALTFFPALALGPIAEHLSIWM